MGTDQVLNYWAQYMRAEDLSPNTIRERLRFFTNLQRDLTTPLLQITRQQLIAYLGTTKWSNSTRQHYRSALHTFYTWAQDEQLRVDNPAARLPRVRVKKREPNPVPVTDIQRMLTSGAYRKTRVMIALHYHAGLRVHEIAKLHGRDIDWTNRILTVTGKGGTTRRIGIGDALWGIVAGQPRDRYWFPNRKANRTHAAGEGHVLSNSVSDVIRDAYLRAGITAHRPHDLRASTATEQSRAGVSPIKIQKAMRHLSLATTELYTQVTVEETREAFNAQPVIYMPHRSGRRKAA